MGIEIERKFLIDLNKLKQFAWPRGDDGVLEIKQAYIVSDRTDVSVRVRITSDPDTADRFYQTPVLAELGVKIGSGPTRAEFEQEIPYKEALVLLEQYPSVHKIRYIFNIENSERYWEVDKFLDEHEGLWIAEIELDSLDEEIELPDWISEEVTYNAEYYNCNLAK